MSDRETAANMARIYLCNKYLLISPLFQLHVFLFIHGVAHKKGSTKYSVLYYNLLGQL